MLLILSGNYVISCFVIISKLFGIHSNKTELIPAVKIQETYEEVWHQKLHEVWETIKLRQETKFSPYKTEYMDL